MKKKDQNILWLIGAGVLVWYLWRKKKMTAPNAKPSQTVIPRMQSAVIEAQSEAAEIANNIISQTEFVPDFTTDADRYAADKKACR